MPSAKGPQKCNMSPQGIVENPAEYAGPGMRRAASVPRGALSISNTLNSVADAGRMPLLPVIPQPSDAITDSCCACRAWMKPRSKLPST